MAVDAAEARVARAAEVATRRADTVAPRAADVGGDVAHIRRVVARYCNGAAVYHWKKKMEKKKKKIAFGIARLSASVRSVLSVWSPWHGLVLQSTRRLSHVFPS